MLYILLAEYLSIVYISDDGKENLFVSIFIQNCPLYSLNFNISLISVI